MRFRFSALGVGALAAQALILMSCTAQTSNPGHGDAPGAAASAGSPSGPGALGSGGSSAVGSGGTSAVGTGLAPNCNNINPGPSLVRRLNRFEYNNTVRDLLGDTTAPANTFPEESKTKLGLDNNASSLTVSPVLIEQYELAAENLASAAIAKMSTLLGCDPIAAGEEACGKSFISSFGQKAFRRPLAADESARLWSVLDAGRQSLDFATGVSMVIQTILQSPAFLYRVEFGSPPTNGQVAVRLTSWEMATRLSYLVWQTMPDDQLTQAAQQDALTKDDAIAAQVTRMLADPRARTMVAHFHDMWLHLQRFNTLEKDPTVFPKFSPEIAGLMSQETHQFLDHLVWDGEGDVTTMFTAPYTYLNAKLASYYGLTAPGDTFSKVAIDPSLRLGLLSQGGLLATMDKQNQTGPVQRGKFIREQLLCMEMPPPPPNVPKAPDLSPTLSTRERFTQHRADPSCSTCHSLMDQMSLSLENFDGAGQYRTLENGKPIDVSGEILSADVPGVFNGATGLAQKLGASNVVKSCVSKAWFQYVYGRPQADADACTQATVDQKFKASGYKIKDLILALTQTDAFRYRNSIPAGGAQ
jgi:hypothetical protein